MNILLTGATGFIGRRLVQELLAQKHKIFVLTRPQSKERAKSLLNNNDINFIEGDIEDTDVLSHISVVSQIIDQIECVVHLAALYDLQASLTDSYMSNVIGTQNIVNLVGKMKNLKYFHYFSTYGVNTPLKGRVMEDDLAQDEFPFPDPYTKTKNDAEHMVRTRMPDSVKTIIHRPGIIIGDSRDGSLDKINGPYFFFDFLKNLKKLGPLAHKIPFLPMPLNKGSLLPVLPVDILVDWCAHIINNPPKAHFRCYHLVPSQTIRTIDFLEYGSKLIGIPMKLIPFKYTQVFPPVFPLLKLPTEIIFYMRQEVEFDRSHLNADYPKLLSPQYRDYLPKIIENYLKEYP